MSSGVVVGGVEAVVPGERYVVGREECRVGRYLGVRMDSVGGLDVRFFQLERPALGLFVVGE